MSIVQIHKNIREYQMCTVYRFIRISENTRCVQCTKTTAARNEAALSYHLVRGLHFLAVVFAAIIYPLHFNIYTVYTEYIQ